MPEENRVFDVARPGHSSPSATSKPIIVGHHPIMSDPMVKDDPGDFGTEASPTRITVQSSSLPAEAAEENNNAPAIIEPPHDEWIEPKAEVPAASNQAYPEAADHTSFLATAADPHQEVNDEHAPVNTADTPSPEPALNEEPTEQPFNHVEALDVMEPRRKSRKGILGLSLVALLIAAYLLLDAGIIENSINLPFHIFKQKMAAPVVSTPAKPQSPATAISVPVGFTEYKLAGTTITFAAPTAWGQPTSSSDLGYTARNATNKSDGTYAYLVTFATNKDLQVAVTSSKYLPPARGAQYYDYLSWCTGTADAKIYLNVLHFSTADKTDTPSTVACDQGPIADATKLDTSTIVQLNTKDPSGAVLGDVYTKNLSSSDLPVFRVKDAAMKNPADIKKLLLTVK